MADNSSSSNNYQKLLKRFYQRGDEMECLRNVMDQIATESLFSKAKLCLSIGTGYGVSDIEFIKRCLPALKKFIVVEKDPNGVEELKVNLKKAFGDDLQVEIYEMTVEEFMETATNRKHLNEVDVVTCFHCLYYMTHSVRTKLFVSCFENWLKPKTGVLLFAHATKENSALKILEELHPYVESLVNSDQLKEELKTLQLAVVKEIPYADKMNLTEYDRDLHELYAYAHRVPISDEMMEKAMRAVAPSGWGSCRCELVLAKSSN